MAGRQHLAAAGIDEADMTAEVLLRYVLDVDRTQLYLAWNRPIDAATWARYEAALDERARGRPVAYITGRREFMGLEFRVDERVLIPRPESEVLVEAALEILGDRLAPTIADIGTGSGALAVSLAVLRPDAMVVATDLSDDALAVAQANAARHAVSDRIRFLRGDLLEPVRAERICLDLIVCNPPYVAPDIAAGLPREIRDFEPRLAVVAPGAGEAVHIRMIDAAPAVLRPGGWLVMEVAAGQAARVVELLKRSGRFDDPQVRRDGLGWERVVAARARPGSSVEDRGDVLQPHV
jgi:release factor glutamine methyltransferase